jgi:hypothetical protein
VTPEKTVDILEMQKTVDGVTHRYVFVISESTIDDVKRIMCEYAEDETCHLNWYDIAVLNAHAEMLMAQKKGQALP